MAVGLHVPGPSLPAARAHIGATSHSGSQRGLFVLPLQPQARVVRARFLAPSATGLAAAGVVLPSTPFELPAALNREGLARVANHLIAAAAEVAGTEAEHLQQEWDVLCAGRLVRSSLERHLRAAGESALEDVIELALIRPVAPAASSSARRAPDWVRGVGCASGLALSACMDGALVLHAIEGDVVRAVDDGRVSSSGLEGSGSAASSAVLSARPIAAWVGHAGPAQVAVMETGPALPATHSAVAVTGGKDGVARLWRLRASASGPAARGSSAAAQFAEPCALLAGHATTVTAAAWGRGLGSVATGDWSGEVCLWDASAASEPGWASDDSKDDAEADPASKARGAKRARRTSAAEPAAVDPAARMPAHTGAVGGVTWASSSSLVTGGWDRTIKIWDPEHTGMGGDGHAAIIDCFKACTGVASAAAAGSGSDCFASSHTDGAVRIWDARAAGGDRGSALRGHSGWASAVAWRPGSSHHLASAGHDGRVALWDTRAPSQPLHWAIQHDGKCLSVAWDSPSVLCSGGSDRRVRSVCFPQ